MKSIIKLFVFYIVLFYSFANANLNAKYYSKTNNVFNTFTISGNEKYWKGQICSNLKQALPSCYQYRQNSCYYKRGFEDCFYYTYNANTSCEFKDRFIAFDYGGRDKDIKNRCWDYVNKRFVKPLPVFSNHTYKDSGWSAVWDGWIKILESSKWFFALSCKGDAHLEIGDKKGFAYKWKRKIDYKNINQINNEKSSGILVDLKRGIYKIKIRYSTSNDSMIFLQWLNTNGYTPKSYNPSPNIKSKMGKTAIIPSEYLFDNINKAEDSIKYDRTLFKVIEKEFANSDENFEWKWKSPLRTKLAGNNNEFCVLAGSSKNGNIFRSSKREKVNVSLYYIKRSIALDSNQNTKKYISSYLTKDVATLMVGGDDTSACFTLSDEDIFTPNAKFIVSLYGNSKDNNQDLQLYQNSNNYFSINPAGFYITYSQSKGNSNFGKIEKFQDNGSDLIGLGSVSKSTITLLSDLKYRIAIFPLIQVKSKLQVVKNVDLGQYGKKTSYINKISSFGNEQSLKNNIKPYPYMIPMIGSNMKCQNAKPISFSSKKDGYFDFDLYFLDNKIDYLRVGNIEKEYNDVMKFENSIVDNTWGEVNFKEIKEFDSLDFEDKQSIKNVVKKYGYMCKGYTISGVVANQKYSKNLVNCDINTVVPRFVKFVPSNFDFSFSGIYNYNEQDYTYINNLNESSYAKAFLITQIYAQKGNKRYKNFSKNCYATDVNLTISYDSEKNMMKNNSSSLKVDNNIKKYFLIKEKFATDDEVESGKRFLFDVLQNSNDKIRLNHKSKIYKESGLNKINASFDSYDIFLKIKYYGNIGNCKGIDIKTKSTTATARIDVFIRYNNTKNRYHINYHRRTLQKI